MDVFDDVLGVLTTYGYVEPSELDGGRVGYRIDGSALEWRLASGGGDGDEGEAEGGVNPFFRDLYENVAGLLDSDDRLFHRLDAREHTAQVESEDREERERRFRQGLAASETRGLPILFCSPTMELGVDIATLNAVYMRNVPPTPANYAQRSRPGLRPRREGLPFHLSGGTARPTFLGSRSPHTSDASQPEGVDTMTVERYSLIVKPSRAEPSRAEPSRAEPSRAEPSRAEG